MFRLFRSFVVLLLVLVLLPLQGAIAAPSFPLPPQPSIPPNCTLGSDTNGSQTLICAPTVNPYGYPLSVTLVIFAHGYVWPYIPAKTIPWDQMVLVDPTTQSGTFVPDLVTNQGYYFATTSYRANGLVVQDAIQDLLLVRSMAIQKIKADGLHPLLGVNVILAGVSEGGLITTLSIERYPGSYKGGLSMCGPIGSFKGQVNYWGDFRTLLDVYYSTIKDYPPGTGSTTIRIPDKLINDWYYDPNLAGALSASAFSTPEALARTQDLLYVAKAPYGDFAPQPGDTPDINNMALTIKGLLDYNIYATMNGQTVLGGNPYGNRFTNYSGSAFYPNLNQLVARYTASTTALYKMGKYETTGKILRPLVALHTTGDPIVPYWHATLYQQKLGLLARFKLDTVQRYGHCAFTQAEVLGAFGDLGKMVNPLLNSQAKITLTPEQLKALNMLIQQGAVLREQGIAIQEIQP